MQKTVRRSLSLLLTIALVLSCWAIVPPTASAADVGDLFAIQKDGITFRYRITGFSPNTVELNSCMLGDEPLTLDIVIPSTVSDLTNNYTVTSIGSSSFRGNSQFWGITVPDTVTAIGDSAFEGCSYLSSVTILGAAAIGTRAFYGCRRIEVLNISNVTSIGDYAFSGCTRISQPAMPSVITIGDYAFFGCELVFMTLPASLISIGDGAFSTTNLSMVYFEGVAPATGIDSFSAMYPSGLDIMAQVYSSGKGFPAPGQLWNGLRIAYYEDDPYEITSFGYDSSIAPLVAGSAATIPVTLTGINIAWRPVFFKLTNSSGIEVYSYRIVIETNDYAGNLKLTAAQMNLPAGTYILRASTGREDGTYIYKELPIEVSEAIPTAITSFTYDSRILSLVAGSAAGIPVALTGTNISGKTVSISLVSPSGNTVYTRNVSPVSDSFTATINLTAAQMNIPAGTYKLRAAIGGIYAEQPIEVVDVANIDLWASPTPAKGRYNDADALEIRFPNIGGIARTIVSVTVNGVAYPGFAADGDSIFVPGAPCSGYVNCSIKLKYPTLYPSFSFTFSIGATL